MKEKALFIFLLLLVVVSIFFIYQRSFMWKNFDLINSEEEVSEEETNPDELMPETSPDVDSPGSDYAE